MSQEKPEWPRYPGIPIGVTRAPEQLNQEKTRAIFEDFIASASGDTCPPCVQSDHRNCFDGDIAREKAEFESFHGDLPPWWGCECDCG